MSRPLYSIRMHATCEQKHLSGAERIVSADAVDAVLLELTARARGKAKEPDRIVVTIDRLGERPLRRLTALDVRTINAPDEAAGRSCAQLILEKAGVSSGAAVKGIALLARGPGPSGGAMRGAVLLDADNGERLEPDPLRGVRVSRFDWDDGVLSRMCECLERVGLTHFRTHEALALATKVASAPGIIAELCWSDDPDYTAGYVAARKEGYIRFPYLKRSGDHTGGRIFFIDRTLQAPEVVIEYLETEPVLISEVGVCRLALSVEGYRDSLR